MSKSIRIVSKDRMFPYFAKLGQITRNKSVPVNPIQYVVSIFLETIKRIRL